jgi:hypothetical protein
VASNILLTRVASKVTVGVAMLFVSVIHGFSQVFGKRELGRNRLNGFQKHRRNISHPAKARCE